MEKRHFNRKRCLATAVAAVGLSALAYNADAGLTLKLVQSGTGPAGNQNISISNLNPFNLDVWATVTGTNGTSSDDGLQIAEMSFTSTGSILGDFSSPGLNPQSPWNSNGASSGTQYGTAGDLNLGSTNPSLAAGHWIAISDDVQSGTGAASNGSGSFKLGTIVFDPSAGTAGQTANLNLVPRAITQGALWFEDATVTNPGGGNPLVWSNDKNNSANAVVGSGAIISFAGVVGTPNLWATTGTGSMAIAANWDNNAVPGANQTLTFAAYTGSTPVTVTVDSGRTVSGLVFNNATKSFNLGGANTLTVNAGSTINVAAGSHTISSGLAMNGTVHKTGSGNLTISGTQTPGVGATLQLDAANTGTVNVASDPNGLGVNVLGGTLNFANGVAAYNVKSLDADENAGQALINVPGGGSFQSELVLITPGGAVNRAQEEAVATDLAYGRFLGTSGISTAHAGHDPLTNIVQQFSDGSSIYLFESIEGDANGDGQADGADISVAAGYQDVAPGTGAAAAFSIYTQMEGDFNGDFLVDGADIGIIAGRMGQSFNPANGAGGVAAVPEPASLGILAIGAVGLLRRRRRA